MKKNLLSWLLAMAFMWGVSACQKDDDVEPVMETMEYQHVRLLVTDEIGKELTLVNPAKGDASVFEARFPKASVYGTEAGRYGALVHTSNNLVEFFDSGLESHGDHVDTKGTPKFAALVGESSKPAHFKSKGNEVLTFNDGDGSMSLAREDDFHTSGAKMRRLETGNVAHHGAMAQFDNGTYAVTEKDGTVSGSLPERVKIIDGAGVVRFSSSLATGGIHGNAGNGKHAVFGSVSGVLVVSESGTQKLISHPDGFGSKWLSSIYYAKGAQQFLGYSSEAGAYRIDVDAGKVVPIFESKEIVQVKLDYSGNSLLVLLYDGSLQIFDLKSSSLIHSGKLLPAISKDDTQKPQIEATGRFVYITQPKTGELLQVDRQDLKILHRHKVSSTPYRVMILGAETDAGH